MKLEKIIIPKIDSLSWAQIEATANELISSAVDGWEDPLELDIRLKVLEEAIKLARQKIDANVRAVAEKEKERYGVKISFRNGFANYDYEKDEEYKRLLDLANQRKELLKNAAKSSHIIITEDGEQIKKVPVKSYTKDSVSYTFEK